MTPFSRSTCSSYACRLIDHVVLNVSDYEASKRFYTAALEPLGYGVVLEFPQMAGLGREGKPEFWIGERDEPSANVHVALASPDRRTVDEFFTAALGAGGRDNGAPGLRPIYHEQYYGAYVLDPDGNNIEAVCHLPE
jgi:catechol 2,3-dioxygenase-like lactoylglutathione lyase family enzyme